MFEQAFAAAWSGLTESDGFNRLVVELGVSWREAALIRTLARYRQQTGLDPSQAVQEEALREYPDVSRALVSLFKAKFEGELAVVISKVSKNIDPENWRDHVAGYTICNDVSSRDLQFKDGQWARAKGIDTFCPLGPWMVTHFSIAEASHRQIVTRLDGREVQHGNTDQMVHTIPKLISYISSFMTLLPGDVILTGTPAGVGPMELGQRVEVEIEGIGTLTNTVVEV